MHASRNRTARYQECLREIQKKAKTRVLSSTRPSADRVEHLSARWSSRGSLPRISEGYGTERAPPVALTLITRGKLTFDEMVELHRVARGLGLKNSTRRFEVTVSGFLKTQRFAGVSGTNLWMRPQVGSNLGHAGSNLGLDGLR